MDYRTLFVTFLASLTVYTVGATALAWRNRKAQGLSWIAGGLACFTAAIVLQGLEGKIPTIFSSLISNELYFPAYAMQMLGLTWFVDRKSKRHIWTMRTVGFFAVLYALLYWQRIAYIANVINAPTVGFIAATIWILLTRGQGVFQLASRVTAFFLFAEMFAFTYRSILTDYIYADPWLVSGRQHDTRWVYSMMMLMFFLTCVAMCDFWFFVLELQRELIAQARTDALTGALNRRALHEEAEREMARSIRAGSRICLLLLDIDNFKAMNDTFGHAAGDMVLKRVVKQVKNTLRTQDLLARTGGEEFAILLPETSIEMGSIVAERVRAAIAALKLTFLEDKARVSVSIGLVEVTSPGASFDSILQRADAAMYAAKRAGKNRVVKYESQLGRSHSGIISPVS